MTEEDLREVFGDCGEISRVALGVKPDGAPKGFAHITFADTASTDKVLISYYLRSSSRPS